MTRAAVKRHEERLRAAVLAGDVAALDALVADGVLLCGPDGAVLRKDDVLALCRDAARRLVRYDPSELVIELAEHVAVVTLRVDVAGDAAGAPFAGPFRCARAWAREHDGGWRVIAASVVAIAAG